MFASEQAPHHSPLRSTIIPPVPSNSFTQTRVSQEFDEISLRSKDPHIGGQRKDKLPDVGVAANARTSDAVATVQIPPSAGTRPRWAASPARQARAWRR